MKHYKVVLSGENIFFENETTSSEPVIGFISCKLIKAASEDLALAIAKRDLLVQWNQSFNADRKLGMPKLHIEHIAEINSWFKPKIHNDYFWFTSAEHKQKQLQQFTRAPKKWFGRKA
jgi:hypothetical protein